MTLFITRTNNINMQSLKLIRFNKHSSLSYEDIVYVFLLIVRLNYQFSIKSSHLTKLASNYRVTRWISVISFARR